MALRAIKRAEANTLDVVDAAETLVADVQAELPQLQIEQAASQAEFIREATRSTIDALALAIVLAGGAVRPGDPIRAELPPAPHRPLTPV